MKTLTGCRIRLVSGVLRRRGAAGRGAGAVPFGRTCRRGPRCGCLICPVAAPVFRRVMERVYFQGGARAPKSKPPPALAAEAPPVLPDLRGLSREHAGYHGRIRGLALSFSGEGSTVVSQEPAGGLRPRAGSPARSAIPARPSFPRPACRCGRPCCWPSSPAARWRIRAERLGDSVRAGKNRLWSRGEELTAVYLRGHADIRVGLRGTHDGSSGHSAEREDRSDFV